MVRCHPLAKRPSRQRLTGCTPQRPCHLTSAPPSRGGLPRNSCYVRYTLMSNKTALQREPAQRLCFDSCAARCGRCLNKRQRPEAANTADAYAHQHPGRPCMPCMPKRSTHHASSSSTSSTQTGLTKRPVCHQPREPLHLDRAPIGQRRIGSRHIVGRQVPAAHRPRRRVAIIKRRVNRAGNLVRHPPGRNP